MKPVLAEVITIGDEILYGQITDTNSQWIGAELGKIGVHVLRKTSIGDREEDIVAALREAEQRVDIVIFTGGLGPTKDDVTKKTLAKYFRSDMYLNEDALALIRSYFEKRGRTINELNRSQAILPVKSKYLENRLGTAPGMWFEDNGRIIVSIAGVPYEMKALMTNHVIPGIQKMFSLPVLYHRFIKTIGVGESILAEKIQEWEEHLPPFIKLAYLPTIMQVRLRLTAKGDSLKQLETSIQKEIDKVVPLIGKYVYGYDDDEIETVFGRMLIDRGMRVAVAESCTGGSLAALLASRPGSSVFFQGGVVAYDNEVKTGLLGVNTETLNIYGAVSEETVKEMAENVRKRFKSSLGIATSGIAGPDGGTEEKPVGTIWIAVSSEKQTVTKLLNLGSTRENNIRATVILAIELARQTLLSEVVRNA